MLHGLPDSAAEGELVDLGQLFGDGDGSVGADDLLHLLEALEQAVGRLIADDSLLHLGEASQQGFFPFLVRQEAVEIEAAAWEARLHEGGDKGCGAGEALDGNVLAHALTDEQEAGVGDAWRARITDQRHRLAVADLTHVAIHLGMLIEDMVSQTAFVNLVVLQQMLGGAGVLGQDEIDRLEHVEGSEGDVFQIADRGWDDVQFHDRRYSITKRGRLSMTFLVSAQNKSRTCTSVRILHPECSASTIPPPGQISIESLSYKVVDVNHTEVSIVSIDHKKIGDTVGIHIIDSVSCQGLFVYGFG